MAKSKTKKTEQPKTSAQQLASLIKSARDIMRKDKELNGDLDRLPLLTWIMFLKFLDDREKLEEARALLAGRKYKPAIEPPTSRASPAMPSSPLSIRTKPRGPTAPAAPDCWPTSAVSNPPTAIVAAM